MTPPSSPQSTRQATQRSEPDVKVPVKLSLYAALLVAVFGAAFFTAQVVAEADRVDDWRPQIHQNSQTPSATELPDGTEEHSEAPQHGEGGK